MAKFSRRAHAVDLLWHGRLGKRGARYFELALRSYPRRHASKAPAFINARHVKIKLRDAKAPSVSAQLAPVTTQAVEVRGSDAGSGVAGFWMVATDEAGANVKRYLPVTCDYTRWQPCDHDVARSFPVPASELAGAVKELTITSVDAGGNESVPAVVQVGSGKVPREVESPSLDTDPPTVAAATPASGWVRGSVQIDVTGSDGGSGVKGLWMQATRGSVWDAPRFLGADCGPPDTRKCPSDAAVSFGLDTMVFGTGALEITVAAEDDAGNYSDPQTITLMIDNTPPAPPGPIRFTASGECNPVTLRWDYDEAGDTGSPLVGLRVTYAERHLSINDDDTADFVMYPPTTVYLPFGADETYGSVTSSSIEQFQAPLGGWGRDRWYSVQIQVQDAAGHVSEPSALYYNALWCAS